MAQVWMRVDFGGGGGAGLDVSIRGKHLGDREAWAIKA